MTYQEQFIKELSELTGTEIALEADDSCTVMVNDVTLVLRYRPTSEDWLMFGTVYDASEEKGVSRAKLAAVLRASFLGVQTGGFMPGLFADSILLSGSVPAQPPSAQAVAEKLVALSEAINKLAGLIAQAEDAAEGAAAAETPAASLEMFRV